MTDLKQRLKQNLGVISLVLGLAAWTLGVPALVCFRASLAFGANWLLALGVLVCLALGFVAGVIGILGVLYPTPGKVGLSIFGTALGAVYVIIAVTLIIADFRGEAFIVR